MDALSPRHDVDSFRDPFELERLAEELATRELAHPKQSRGSQDSHSSHELPVYIPLTHDNPYLTSEAFDVEEFLLSRSHTSLHDLRSELREYLSTLKEELVKLINDDYEAFISLSTDLRGEGARLDRLKFPLGDLKAQILQSRDDLHVIQNAIEEKLHKRAILREEKALLHLLLKISELVTRLESLLLIASPSNEDPGAPNIPSHLSITEDEDRTRGNRAKHLGRVAAEYNQLLYHVSKARIEKCVFVDEIQWRVDRIQSTLSSDLDHLFAMTLVSLNGKGDSKTADPEKTKWTSDLTECLRIYDMLGLWRDAEDVLRREVVRSFVKKTVFPGALAVPHSPIVPHTPLPSSRLTVASSSQQPPRTPYTPFSAFALKQNPFQSGYNYGGSSSPSPYAHLLDDTDDALARLYNQILRFVERDLVGIMEIAEKVSVKSVSGFKKGRGLQTLKDKEKAQNGTPSSENRFEIMANVVWAELGSAIIDDLGGVVFAAGKPNEFRKHHETTQAFIRSLEFLAPSVQSIEDMRLHPVYGAFERRWQLPVYFQLRWKETIGKLEDVLAVTKIEASASKKGKSKESFVTLQAEAIWTAISGCWSAEVYIPELSHRFWKLTLQLLSRYKTWLDSSLPALDFASRVTSLSGDKSSTSPANLSRAATPNSSAADTPSGAEVTAVDDSLLRQCSAAIVDIRAMQLNVLTLWREEISMMLPEELTSGSVTSSNDDVNNAEAALQHALSLLTSLIPPMSNQIATILTKRCSEALLPVRSIPSQFRAMSSKRVPTEPSYFVASVLRPLKVFFAIGSGEGLGEALKDDFLDSFAADVFESVSQRYVYYLLAMRKTEESLRRLKKGKKSTYSLFGSSTKDDEGRDEERIQTQMILDVEAFGKDAESLGVNLANSEAFKSLNDMVHSSIGEST